VVHAVISFVRRSCSSTLELRWFGGSPSLSILLTNSSHAAKGGLLPPLICDRAQAW
jgi:hypothetical protein